MRFYSIRCNQLNATDGLMVTKESSEPLMYISHRCMYTYQVVFLRMVTTVILKIPCSHFLVQNVPVAKKIHSGLSLLGSFGLEGGYRQTTFKKRVSLEVATPVCLLLLLVSIIFLTIKKNHSGGHSTLLVSCPPGAGWLLLLFVLIIVLICSGAPDQPD